MRTIQLGLCAVAALASAGCADTVVNRTELAMPPSITTKMAKGFTLYMVKAILSGRGGARSSTSPEQISAARGELAHFPFRAPAALRGHVRARP